VLRSVIALALVLAPASALAQGLGVSTVPEEERDAASREGAAADERREGSTADDEPSAPSDGGLGAPTGEPAGEDGGPDASTAEEEPGGGLGVSTAEEEPNGGLGVSTAEEEPGGGLGASTAEEEPNGGLGVSTAEEEPNGGLGVSTAEQAPSDGPGATAEAARAAGEAEGGPAEAPSEALDASRAADGSDVAADGSDAGDERPAGAGPGWTDERAVGWALFGGSVGVGILGAVLLAVGVDDLNTVENAPGGSDWDDVVGAYERAPVLTATGAVVLGLGIAGAAAGAAVLAVWGGEGTWLEVSALPGGLRVRGRF
jgi:hypothetical protein